MIRYALSCDKGHAFESWFPSSSAYDSQRKRRLVSCPMCGSTQIVKQLMTPSVSRAGPAAEAAPAPVPSSPAQPVALMSPAEHELRAKLRELRAELVKNSDYVGGQFPEEARRMHSGEIEHRSIWGEATPDEARELIDDGVEVVPLPPAFEDRN